MKQTVIEHARTMADLCAGVLPTTHTNHVEWHYSSEYETVYLMGTNDAEDVRDCLFADAVVKTAADAALAIRAFVAEQHFNKSPWVTVVGHSLGGAMAPLVAKYSCMPIYEVITFGAPRLFYVNHHPPAMGRCLRVYRRDDPIVSLKPAWLGYRHPTFEELPLGKPWWKRIFKRNIIHNHHMSAYVEALGQEPCC